MSITKTIFVGSLGLTIADTNNIDLPASIYSNIGVDTNKKQLDSSNCNKKIQAGNGSGSAFRPEVAAKNFEKIEQSILDSVSDADLIFIVGGLGGGTGSGLIPAIAKTLQEANKTCIVLATLPLRSEGLLRSKIAKTAIKNIEDSRVAYEFVDLNKITNSEQKFTDLMNTMSKVLAKKLETILDFIYKQDSIDLADIQRILSIGGQSLIHSVSDSNLDYLIESIFNFQNIQNINGYLLKIEGNLTNSEYQLIVNEVNAHSIIMVESKYVFLDSDTTKISIIATGIGRDEELELDLNTNFEEIKKQHISVVRSNSARSK
jgi:cell division GTPase FtsZ